MNRLKFVALSLVIVTVLAWVQPALADGIIIPEPPPRPDPPPLRDTWLTILYHRVSVTIDDQVATTHVEQEFLNEHTWEAEGTYVFPLPEGAVVSEFVMWVDGRPVESKVLEADEARSIYEEIVRQRRDPALLEYVGRGAVQARIFPIPPGETRKIELEYSQVLPVENGLVRYVYPLNTEKFSARPLEEVSVRIDVRSAEPMRAVYSPTHQDRVFIERESAYHAIIGYEEMDVLPTEDFELIYTVSQEDVGLNLLTYREPGDDGFFLLLVAPKVEVSPEQVIQRDIILVLDTSGSMDGEKIEQAQDALAYVLDHLHERDRFNVVAFSTGLRQYARGLRPASEARDAIDWVRGLEAVGGTDINRALLEALALAAGSTRPAVIIFLTDGLPTEGVTKIDQILSNVAASAPDNVRIFPFGVGDDVNTTLLDTLAEQHRGAPAYIRAHERIDEEVSAFYAKVSTPVLSDIEIDFGSVLAEDAYPYPLPDLFAGTQLLLAGRYREGGPTRITIRGRVDDEVRVFEYEGNFRAEGGDSFIPRLWATRKIGHLLTQIRLHGERHEWVDAIIELSVRYGIITPYTSFLIEEDDILTAEGQEEAAERLMEQPQAPASGAEAVQKAEGEAQLRDADAAGGGMLPEEAAQIVQLVGSKTFVLQSGVWTDTSFDPSRMSTVKVGFGSDHYFDLLESRPEWGPYLALGTRVIFVAEGTAYEVVEGGGGPVELPPAHTPETPATMEPATPTPEVVETPEATASEEPDVPSEPTAIRPAASSARRLCGSAPALLAATLVTPVVALGHRRRRHRLP